MGVNLKTDVTPFELADFITYWKAEGKAFHHDQWQQKLARSVQLSRTKPARTQQRDVNAVPEPDSEIPQDFAVNTGSAVAHFFTFNELPKR